MNNTDKHKDNKIYSLSNINKMVSLRNSGMSYREVAMFFGCSATTICNELKKAKKDGFTILDSKQGYQYFRTRKNHLARIKINIETFTEVEKYLCKEILNLKKNGLTNKEVIKILKISMSNLDKLVSKMKLTGRMDDSDSNSVCGYRPVNNLDEEMSIVNQFEMIAKNNISIRDITQVLSISRSKLYRIIYKHLIKNENI